MSKGLEALGKLKKVQLVHDYLERDTDIIEKSLKSFEISKEVITKIKKLCSECLNHNKILGPEAIRALLDYILEKEKELYD